MQKSLCKVTFSENIAFIIVADSINGFRLTREDREIYYEQNLRRFILISRRHTYAEKRMKSLGWRCETEVYVQHGCFIHTTRGRTAARTDMEHLVPSKRIRSREIAADDKFQFKRQRDGLRRCIASFVKTKATLSSRKWRTRNRMKSSLAGHEITSSSVFFLPERFREDVKFRETPRMKDSAHYLQDLKNRFFFGSEVRGMCCILLKSLQNWWRLRLWQREDP